MQRRHWNAPDGADDPEVPVLRGLMPIFPAPAPIRPVNLPVARNVRRGLARIRSDSPDTAIEYDQNEVEALKRMKDFATRQVNGLALIGNAVQETPFIVINDDVRAVREAEERYLMRELDLQLKSIREGDINRTAILMIMTPLCNYLERIEMELTNTRNLLTDIEARQLDLVDEMRHVERICQILQGDDKRGAGQP
ncbi:unnamed protein product [Angiostrongylus costaricensis]|uniref:Mediator of RNA polymerase II transcription subunit 7 n=1 Tax=Angiostrongylus costaricensis TaxID=334426 RepID=A0A0R3PP62_ANGCS|nr:unnamed protein product [Angiostrongylus costaricensis]